MKKSFKFLKHSWQGTEIDKLSLISTEEIVHRQHKGREQLWKLICNKDLGLLLNKSGELHKPITLQKQLQGQAQELVQMLQHIWLKRKVVMNNLVVGMIGRILITLKNRGKHSLSLVKCKNRLQLIIKRKKRKRKVRKRREMV